MRSPNRHSGEGECDQSQRGEGDLVHGLAEDEPGRGQGRDVRPEHHDEETMGTGECASRSTRFQTRDHARTLFPDSPIPWCLRRQFGTAWSLVVHPGQRYGLI